jgi:hypothetical protein
MTVGTDRETPFTPPSWIVSSSSSQQDQSPYDSNLHSQSMSQPWSEITWSQPYSSSSQPLDHSQSQSSIAMKEEKENHDQREIHTQEDGVVGVGIFDRIVHDSKAISIKSTTFHSQESNDRTENELEESSVSHKKQKLNQH